MSLVSGCNMSIGRSVARALNGEDGRTREVALSYINNVLGFQQSSGKCFGHGYMRPIYCIKFGIFEMCIIGDSKRAFVLLLGSTFLHFILLPLQTYLLIYFPPIVSLAVQCGLVQSIHLGRILGG